MERPEMILRPRIVDKPWGHEEWLCVNDRYVTKMLCVNAGEMLSLQKHLFKRETWHILEGNSILTLADQEIKGLPGMVIDILPNTVHRIKAIDNVKIFEVSTAILDDVVRLKDKYGR